MARKKVPEKRERPKLRKLFPERGPKWLIMEPARIAPVGGALFAALAMVYYVALQAGGAVIPPMDVVLGVLKTFVVSYAGTGLFIYFVMRVVEREFPEEDPRRRLGLMGAEEGREHDEYLTMTVPGMNDDSMQEGEDNA